MIVLVEDNRKITDLVTGQLEGHSPVVHAGTGGALKKLIAESGDKTEVILLGPGIRTEDSLQTADWLRQASPEVSVVMLAKSLSSDTLHAALRSGVRDVVPYPSTPEQLREAVARGQLLARSIRGRMNGSSHEETAGKVSRIVTIFSAKGGCGKSIISTNLAVLLAQAGNDVALVDLDLQSGDLAIMLQLQPQYSIEDAAGRLPGLDAGELTGYMTPHSSGLKLLAAPFEPQGADAVTGSRVQEIIQMLAESFDYVVIDGPSSFTDQLLAIIDRSDECILVASMDVPSIKNVRVSLNTLIRLGIDPSRLRLVLNRSDSKVGLHIKEVEQALGREIDVAMPSSRDVPLSVNQGIPLAIRNRKSSVVAAVARLMDLVRAPARSPVGTRR